jgi:hypothetical protein
MVEHDIEADAQERSERTSRTMGSVLAWALIALALLALAYRTLKFGGYFPDDAFITFRFAENLARGFGIVWNVGGAPTEGSTSILQTLLMAGFFKAGYTVETGAYAISIGALVVLLFVLWRISGRLMGGFSLSAAIPFALALSSANYAIHFNSGMDTVVSTTLLTASFLASLALVQRASVFNAVALAVVSLLCLWCRPDAAPFLAGQGLVLGLAALFREGLMRRLFLAYGIVLLVGLAFMAWKLSYFGYLLPNSFYVKGTEPQELAGLEPVLASLKTFGMRMAYLIPLVFFVDWKALLRTREDWLLRLALLVVPVALFLGYNITTLHLVDYNHRFEFPVSILMWVAAAWFLTAGRAAERLGELLAHFGLGRIGILGAAAAGVLMVGVAGIQDRVHHRQWFAWVQWLHYEPVTAALLRVGAGPDVTLVYDAAGYIPFASRTSFIDPVGLVDNTLSGREPITPIEREEYIWGSNPDVYLGPFPPASAGASGPEDDPITRTSYFENIILDEDTFEDYGHFMRSMSPEEEIASKYFRMIELRDNWIALGEIPYTLGTPPEYTHFLYVRKASPHADRLVEELSKVTNRAISEIDFDNLPEGREPFDLETANRLSALN